MSRTARHLVAATVASTSLVAGFGAPALADGPPKGPAGEAPATEPTCTLRSPSHDQQKHEWASCLTVDTSLDRLPTKGGTAKLSVTVTADTALDADITVDLPDGMSWVSSPKGLSAKTTRSARPEDGGTVARATGSKALAKGQRVTYTGVVRADEAGAAQIRATATAPFELGDHGDSDSVFLTVGSAGAASAPGIAAPAGGADTAAVPAGATVSKESQTTRAPVVGAPKPGAPAAPCDTQVTGRWSYQDQDGAWHGAMNTQVQVWDADVLGDTKLATGVTNSAGDYTLCFDSAAESWPDTGTPDIYVRFVTENSIWKVQRGGSAMTFTTGTTNDVAAGSTLNLGTLTTGDPALQRGLHAFAAANDAWLWVPKPTNSCFDQSDSSCRQLVINWAPDSTDGTYYSLGGNDVHLAADDPNSAITVVHEIGHAVMDDVYDDDYPPAPNCNPHSITGASSAGCAWTEGFAEWFPSTVYGDPYFRWPSGASLNLETNKWGDTWNTGDTVEGRVAGALIDLTDTANESPWDRVREGRNPTWAVFTGGVQDTMAQYFAQRSTRGTSQKSTLFNNTIDYTFRDTLPAYAGRVRPQAYAPHNFRYRASTPYWSVVGAWPRGTSDHDVRIYDDTAQTQLLGSSAYSGQTVDFVAVDSNSGRRPVGDWYYPRTSLWSGTGGHRTQLAQGSDVLTTTSRPTFSASRFIAIRDTYLYAGTTYTFTADPARNSMNPSMFLMGSTAGSSSTYVRPRSTALAVANSAGVGATETFSYTPSASGWYGLVVVNERSSGAVDLTRTGGAAGAPVPAK